MIFNSGKGFLIGQLRSERNGFIQQLIDGSRRIGEPETELRQIAAPWSTSERNLSSNDKPEE